jgi:hypothetical protein
MKACPAETESGSSGRPPPGSGPGPETGVTPPAVRVPEAAPRRRGPRAPARPAAAAALRQAKKRAACRRLPPGGFGHRRGPTSRATEADSDGQGDPARTSARLPGPDLDRAIRVMTAPPHPPPPRIWPATGTWEGGGERRTGGIERGREELGPDTERDANPSGNRTRAAAPGAEAASPASLRPGHLRRGGRRGPPRSGSERALRPDRRAASPSPSGRFRSGARACRSPTLRASRQMGRSESGFIRVGLNPSRSIRVGLDQSRAQSESINPGPSRARSESIYPRQCTVRPKKPSHEEGPRAAVTVRPHGAVASRQNH